MATTNEHTGDSLITKAPTDAYRNGWDALFKKKLTNDLVETKESEDLMESLEDES